MLGKKNKGVDKTFQRRSTTSEDGFEDGSDDDEFQEEEDVGDEMDAVEFCSPGVLKLKPASKRKAAAEDKVNLKGVSSADRVNDCHVSCCVMLCHVCVSLYGC